MTAVSVGDFVRATDAQSLALLSTDPVASG